MQVYHFPQRPFVPSGITGDIGGGNVIYVDGVNGDDSTGKKGTLANAFKTLDAANAIATSGDLIYVFAGSYANAAIIELKHQVNWYFEVGAKVTMTQTDNSWDIMWYAGGNDPLYAIVGGYGEFEVDTGFDLQSIIAIQSAGPRIFFQCSKAITNGNSGYNVYSESATVGNTFVIEEVIANGTSGRCYPRGADTVMRVGKFTGVTGTTLRASAEDGSYAYIGALNTPGPCIVIGINGGRFQATEINVGSITLQNSSGDCAYDIESLITTAGDCFINLINGTTYLNINRALIDEDFLCQSTGGAAEDNVIVESVDAVTAQFIISSGGAVNYKIGRARASGAGSVQIVDAPNRSRFECDYFEAATGHDPDSVDPGMIYVRNNSNTKNVQIGGTFKLTGANSYPMVILGSNNDIKLRGSSVLSSGTGVTASIWSNNVAQSVKIEGEAVADLAADDDIMVTYGTLTVNAAVN